MSNLALLLVGLVLGGAASQVPQIRSLIERSTGNTHAADKDSHAHGSAGHSEGEEAEEVRLDEKQIELADIKMEKAALSELPVHLALTGEVSLNRDRVVEVVPVLPGLVREAKARLGEDVRAGSSLAVVESRELADAWSELLAAREKTSLAQSRFAREEQLFQKKISPEQEFFEARQNLAEAQIAQRTAEQKLRTFGFTDLQAPQRSDITRYPVLAPIGGTIIEKKITEGEYVEGTSAIVRIAQLDQVWILANVYPKDIGRVKVGQEARITVQGYTDREFNGKIAWIAAVLDEKTRTLQIRIEADNKERLLRPGVFARVHVAVEKKTDAIVLPVSAVVGMKGKQTVFMALGEGRFAPREVVVGTRAGKSVEIAWGIDPGEDVVTSGAFLLKSELEKAGFEAGHGH